MRGVWSVMGAVGLTGLLLTPAGCDRAPAPAPTGQAPGNGGSRQAEGMPRDEAREDLLALITPHVQRLRGQIDRLKDKHELLPEATKGAAGEAIDRLEREYAGLKAKAEDLRTVGAESLETLGSEVREGVERLGREVQRIASDFNL